MASEILSSEQFSKWLIKTDEVEWNKNKILGSGSYGTVYKGKCRGKDVAVKRLSRQIRPKNLQDLLSEVNTMSQILHPNVLLFMGVCTELGNLMIVTELMHGSVESVLKKRKDLTTYQCMNMAKDAALGLNWLHRSNPPIIHRDIKLGNLLVDESLKVKVCDFGFAMHLSEEWCKEEAKGSPLYMAPECLQGNPYNAKSDIYSFGLILWELYTRDILFDDIESEEQLIETVCVNNIRPKIPNNCPDSLRNLMTMCWHPDPNARPTFKEVLEQLDHVLIDTAIEDVEGRKFWKKYFLTKEYVDWNKFCKLFEEFLNVEGEFGYVKALFLNIPRINSVVCAYFNVIAGVVNGKVSLVQFGNVLKWFGPIHNESGKVVFLENVCKILENSCFHLKITKNDSEQVLASQKPGTYLLRLSSEPGSFGLSCVAKDKPVLHFRIKYQPGVGYTFDDNLFGSLDEFIEKVRKPYNLTDGLKREVDVLSSLAPNGYVDPKNK